MLSASRPTLFFDVIIVGAGPGGSAAAAVALRRGLSVAQVERHAFPRVKACGGGLTVKSFRAAPIDLSPMARGGSREVEFNLWRTRRNRFTRRQAKPLLQMVDRPAFDDWFVGEHRKHPAFRFFDDERVVAIEHDGARFTVQTPRRTLAAAHLVGADGAYSVVNRQFRVTEPRGMAVAIEVTLSRRVASLDHPIEPCFDFGAVPRGYGWVFPKDDHWNVGLYTLDKHHTLRDALARYIEAKGFRVEGDPLATLAAHRFPYGGDRVRVPQAPVYVVGDAGGFGDPIMGEGIYHALESGRIAGETIADCVAGRAQPRDYYARIERTVLRDTWLTYHVSREFYRNVDKALTILENPFIWRPFVEGYASGATFAQSVAGAWWLLPKAIARRAFRYRRDGASRPLALGGPLRGLAYLCEPLMRRVQRRFRRAAASDAWVDPRAAGRSL